MSGLTKVFVEVKKGVGDIFPTVILGGLQGAGDAVGTQAVVENRVPGRLGEGFRNGRNDPRVGGIGIRDYTAAIGCNERQARRHGLQRCNAEWLARIRMEENITVRVYLR